MADNFAGRTRELHLVSEALAAAQDGEGRLVVVAGEPGVGKTRFCHEVASRAESSGFRVVQATCWPESGAPPLWPWHSVLADLVGGDGRAGGSVLAGDSGEPVPGPERFARFTAVADQIAQECARTPTLVIIEDAHSADPGTVSLTRFVARGLPRLPLVLLLTRRPGTGGDASFAPLRELEGEATALTLRPFDPAETAAFLRCRGLLDVDAELQRVLWRLTGGNPSRLQRVIARGHAAPAGPLDAVERPGPAVPVAGRMLRDDVEAAILQALDRLDADTRCVLGRAAVLGSSALTAEAAAVAGRGRAAFAEALGRAERDGLVIIDRQDRFEFTHELVREFLEERLTRGERCEAHARAADALARRPPTADTQPLARLAHHAVRAAERSSDDAQRAIAECRMAATALLGGFSYDEAGSILESAVSVHERAGLTGPTAALRTEWALAVQAAGWPARAQELFDRAAATALAEGNTIELARAALGLGGVWVNEHRTRAEWERVIGLQRRVLAELPAGERSLRCRLAVRLAAEEACRGAPVQPVLDAVEEARRLGDDAVLAEALSLCHQALLRPRFARVRLALAEELIAVASPSGEGLLALVGLLWRAVDLFHLGDLRAASALAELRARAEALNCRAVLCVAEVIETMRLIRAGRLDDAEAKAASCLRLGTAVGDADAFAYFGSQLTTIRWLQDRGDEMLAMIEDLTASPVLAPAEFAAQATVAYLAAGAGQHDKARLVLDRVDAFGLARLPESSTWLGGMCAVVKAAHVLGHAGIAQQAYDLLAPYAELPMMPLAAVTCLGSVERPLGLAAATIGHHDLAIEHLDRAVTANRLLGNRPVTAITLTDLAEALLRRAGPGDRARAAGLLAEARQMAEDLGMTRRAAAWKERLQELETGRGTIRHQGRHWFFALDGREAIVSDRLGMAYLARLLTSPGRCIPALELAAQATPAASASGHQPVIDDQAKAAYRRRAEDLAQDLAEAERDADLGRAELLRLDLDALVEELDRAGARGGRTRAFPRPQERARTAVRKAIKRAIDEITAADATLGAVLQATITTGATCGYIPDPEQPIVWVR